MSDLPQEEVTMSPEEAKQFKDDRRNMAWICLISLIAVTVVSMFWLPLERLEKLEDIITWFYMATMSIVGLYYGVKSWVQVSGKK